MPMNTTNVVREAEHVVEYRVRIRSYGRRDLVEQETAKSLGRQLVRMHAPNPDTGERMWEYALVRSTGELVPVEYDPNAADGEHDASQVISWGEPEVDWPKLHMARSVIEQLQSSLSLALALSPEVVGSEPSVRSALTVAGHWIDFLDEVFCGQGGAAPLPYAQERAAEIAEAQSS